MATADMNNEVSTVEYQTHSLEIFDMDPDNSETPKVETNNLMPESSTPLSNDFGLFQSTSFLSSVFKSTSTGSGFTDYPKSSSAKQDVRRKRWDCGSRERGPTASTMR